MTCLDEAHHELSASLEEMQKKRPSSFKSSKMLPDCFLQGGPLINLSSWIAQGLWSMIGEVTVWGQPVSAVKLRGPAMKYLKSIVQDEKRHPVSPKDREEKKDMITSLHESGAHIYSDWIHQTSCSPWLPKSSNVFIQRDNYDVWWCSWNNDYNTKILFKSTWSVGCDIAMLLKVD